MIDKVLLNKLNEFKSLVLGSVSPDSKLMLFGSYATGQSRAESDIDIAVIVPESDDSFQEEINLRVKALSIDPRIVPLVFTQQDFDDVTPLTVEIKNKGMYFWNLDFPDSQD